MEVTANRERGREAEPRAQAHADPYAHRHALVLAGRAAKGELRSLRRGATRRRPLEERSARHSGHQGCYLLWGGKYEVRSSS